MIIDDEPLVWVCLSTFSEQLTSEDDYHDCWITIFGFPSTAASYILEQFSQYGTILKHIVSYMYNVLSCTHMYDYLMIMAMMQSNVVFLMQLQNVHVVCCLCRCSGSLGERLCAVIVSIKVTSNGNWMHILYQSRLQAKKVR